MPDGLSRVVRTLRGMDQRVDDLTPVWPRVGAIIARANAKAFATKGASTGRPWKPLAASTVEQKLREGHRAMLVKSGAMKRSFTGRPMGVELYFGKQAKFGPAGILPEWQQFGTHQNGRRHIPPRLIQKLNKEDRKAIKDMVARWIVKGM